MEQIVILVAVLVLLYFVMTRTVVKSTSDDNIKVLYRQAARYAVASLQDESEVIKVLHANYAMGYFMALKDLATGEDFKRVTGEDMLLFEQKMASVQDAATQALVSGRPSLVPLKDEMLLKAIYAQTI